MADNVTFSWGDAATRDDGSAHHQQIVESSFVVSDNFNRPANTTPYSVDDAVSDNATAGSVTPLSWTLPYTAGRATDIKIRKSDQTVATPTLRLYLFSASPTVAAGDNESWTTSPPTLANCLGFVDVDVTEAGSDDAVGFAQCSIPLDGLTSKVVYGLLRTLSAFTPASAETFTVDIKGYAA